MNRNEFMELGKSFINLISANFPGSQIFKDVQIIPGWSIFYLVEIEKKFNCQFREWAGNPFHFVVEKGNRKLAQLDLTKILKENGKFTWYLSKPTNRDSLKIYDTLFEFIPETPNDYREKVKEQKILLKSNPTVFKAGYLFVEDASQNEFEEQFINFIRNLYEYAKNPLNWKGKKLKITETQITRENIFNLEDIEAEEGYKEDKKYLYTHRNRDLVQKRKELDNYTCQICGFNFSLEGKYIIECHHLNPLSESDVRITNINDLISVCPTCHWIIHLRKPPFTPDEVKSFLNK